MAEIVELGVGVAGGVHLGGGIEAGDRIALFGVRAVGDDVGERHLIELSGNLRHQDLSGVDRLYYAGNPNFALDFGRLGVNGRRRRVRHLSGESTAGCQ